MNRRHCQFFGTALAQQLAADGKVLPGSHIPIRPPAALRDDPPNGVLILPWNIADEVKAQLADLAEQGVRFTTAVPELRVDQQGLDLG